MTAIYIITLLGLYLLLLFWGVYLESIIIRKIMLDLNRLQQKIDEALEKETKESLTKWLNDIKSQNIK